MPIDPSIIGGLQPIRPVNVLGSVLAIEELKARREAAAGLAEQRQALAAQRQQQMAAAARAQQEEQALRSRLAQGTPVTIEELASIVGPERATKIDEGLMKVHTGHADALASGLGAIEALPIGMRGEAYGHVRQQAIGQGWARDKDLPEQYSPEVVARYTRAALSPEKQAEIAQKQAELNKPITVAAGATVLDPVSRQAIYTAPKAENKQYQQKEMLNAAGERVAVNYDPDTGKHYDVDGKEVRDLRPAPPEVDPTLKAIRDLTLSEAKRNVGTLPAKVQTRVDAQTKAFDTQPVVRKVQTMAEAVGFAKSLDPNTKNPADDQALIYSFAKAMDPDSVVREGEYATVQKYAQSWAQSFGFNAARVFSNTAFLTPEARANMKRTISAKFAAARSQYDNLRSGYASRINSITGQKDGDDFLIDYAGAFPTDDDAPPDPSKTHGVKAPDGVTYWFPTKAEADVFKQRAGIK